MHRRYCAPLAVLALLGGHPARADSDFYLTFGPGAFLAQDVIRAASFSNQLGRTASGTITTDNTVGFNLNHGLGYRLGHGFRIEVELGYAHFSIAGATPQVSAAGAVFARLNGTRFATGSGGSRDVFTAKVNGFYDLPVTGRVVPYVGAGIGVYRAEAQETLFVDGAGATVLRGRSSHAGNAIVMGEAGLTVPLNPRWSIAPAYRFEHLFVRGGGDVDAHVLRLAVHYNF